MVGKKIFSESSTYRKMTTPPPGNFLPTLEIWWGEIFCKNVHAH